MELLLAESQTPAYSASRLFLSLGGKKETKAPAESFARVLVSTSTIQVTSCIQKMATPFAGEALGEDVQSEVVLHVRETAIR